MRNELIKNILDDVNKIADTSRNIVIVGEYGSGKSWLARKIHELSNRSREPFIDINCYTIRDEEADRSIFGYLSFTDNGININRGVLEQGKKGTIFLKGFDSFSEKLQSKIIDSVTSNKTFHLGSQRSIPIDIRFISSIDIKTFYNARAKYNVLKTILDDDHYIIFYPPLRHRRDEIPFLIKTFLTKELSHRYDFISREISPRALYQCICYHWPGNVKQLKNTIEHAAIVSDGEKIRADHLPASIRSSQPKEKEMELLKNDTSFVSAEKRLLIETMHEADSEKEIARILGMDLPKLKQKLERYHLLENHF